MDEKAMVAWSEIAQKLARRWLASMRASSRARIDEDDIRDFLIDLWLEKGGRGPEFEAQNRGVLHNYTALHVGNSRDAMGCAWLLSEMGTAGGDDEAIHEDRFGFLSCFDNGFDDEPCPADQQADGDEMAMLGVGNAGASNGDDVLDVDAAKAGLREALDQRLEELAAIRDAGLSGALAEIFGTTDRSGRTFASEVRSEKMLALLNDSARKRGKGEVEVKRLAAEIATERRKTVARINAAGGDLSYSEIESFEEMMGLPAPTPTAMSAKTRLQQAKQRRKSVPAMQLELV